MPPQSTDHVWRLKAAPDLHAALLREMRRRKCETRAELLRSLLADGLDDKSLAQGRPAGRPPKKPAG